jgi:ankyrin repeat protein
MVASWHGHESCLSILIAAGANVNAKCPASWTPAIHAAFYGQQPKR